MGNGFNRGLVIGRAYPATGERIMMPGDIGTYVRSCGCMDCANWRQGNKCALEGVQIDELNSCAMFAEKEGD